MKSAVVREFKTKKVSDRENEYSSPKEVSDKYSKTLKTVSEFDTSFESNLDLLKKMRVLMLDNLKICDGAYKAKPNQYNSYALTNMVNQIKELTERVEDSIDYNEVTNNVIRDVINPFIEKVILTLGNIISHEIDSRRPDERKLLKKVVNNIFKKYAADIETKIPELNDSIVKNIINQVK